MAYTSSLRILAFVVLSAFFSGLADVQARDAPAQGVVQQQGPQLDDLKQQAKAIADQLQQPASSDETLVNFRLQLDGLSKRLLDTSDTLRHRLAEINRRMEQLGAVPSSDTSAEPAIVTEERSRLSAEKAEINAVLGDTEDTSLLVKQMFAKVSNLRRELFTGTLSQRVDLDSALGSRVVTAARDQFAELGAILGSWWRFVITFKLNSFLAATFFAFAAALIIQRGARRVLGPLYKRDSAIEAPPYLSRLSVAFWSTAIPSGAVGAFFATTYFFFSYFNILRPDIADLLRSLFIVLGIVFFISRLAFACISPYMPAWRLVPIAPRPGHFLVWLIIAIALVNGADSFFGEINRVLTAPLSLTMAKSLILTLVVSLLILIVAFLKPVEKEDGGVRPWSHVFRAFLVLLGLLPIMAALLGFIGLARFISQQIVVTGAFLVVMYLGLLTGRAISEEQAFASSPVGRMMRERFHCDEATLDQLGLIVGIFINFAVALIGIPLVLMQFGFQWAELKNSFYHLLTGFQIGSISISLMGLLTGLALFVIGYLLTRWFQNWLDSNVMARGRVDAGVRNSIRTVIGYVGLVLAALVAVSAAGFNLSSLALIAGGLSLGIGFGLQNIVQNFVSGLILLAERPFRVGDWIEAGGVSGIVKKISVRATEVETFQKQSIVVPNSSLINGNVGNWTLRNKLGRIDINVQTGYTEDPRRVHMLLMEIIRSHPSILKNPEPFVAFQNMTDSLLVFDIYAFVADITATGGIKNELRFQIVERFHAENIHLASSSTTLVLDAREIEKLPEPPEKESAPSAKARRVE
ncbi:mechanosensitive ion channel [Falsochrobactrum sp. TDYN1]|uniref:Mechanosensitive ion channel n=1 Tax=Falsochrobactrum tianjinense TaxID=2706015 RepID=A0A949PMK2_9HYPH|nr:mechanosensitive ion channel domain-containing protein [Falsochrobactrum sp. TDYN1]MBV2143858.1 mechanosensitive ion channel [Falsochrobactrum sp. TDYN1]